MKTKNLFLGCLFASFTLVGSAQEIVLKGKELFGDITARQIGPALMSGRIIDMEVHPTNPQIIYTGTAGGGVWKSNDGGATYAPIFEEHIQSIGQVAVDPNDPDNIVWVGTGEIWTRNSVSVGDGLYRSKDGGVNWDKMGFENSERISGIEIHPENSDVVYVSVLGALWSPSTERGIYKTTDGGKTWNNILYVDENTGAADFMMDPNNPNVLYAAMWEHRRTAWDFNSGGKGSALYKTTDGGATWNKIHNGFPDGILGRIGIAVAPSDSNRVYAVIESEKDKGLYRSNDAGATWELTNSDFALTVRPFYFSRIVVDPKNPDVVVKGGLSGSISKDGGETFVSLGNMHSDIHDIVFDINDSDRMHVGTDGGVYRSWNQGTTMEIVSNLPLSQFYHISVDDAEPYRIYGGLQDNGSWYGPSSSPGGIEARDWVRVGVGDGFRVLKHPTKEILYSEMQGADNVWRYDMERNYTKNVKPLPVSGYDDLRFNWNAPMAISAHQPDRFYMGSQYLHVSDDMGDTWRIISPDLTTNDPAKQPVKSGGLSNDTSGAEKHTTIFTIAESPLDEKIIWVGTDDGNVQVTKDGGKNWTNVTANISGVPANTWVYHIEASVHGKGTAYAVFDGHASGDMKPYVYKTKDYGATWTNIVTDDIPIFARNIQEDYVNEDLLFLGAENGLYITVNGGKNWSHFTNNFPHTAVHFLDLQKKTNDLVAGTHGRGVIIIDDISTLREITQDVLAKKVHFFETKTGTMVEEGGFGGGSTELEFVGRNPGTSLQLKYYLQKRHTFGKMSLEIQDMEGNEVTTLTPGKSKGINIVRWGYNTKAPKNAAGKTISQGGFQPMRAKAGTYKAILKKGKDTYETTFKIQNDPKSFITKKEREAQHATAQKLFDLQEDLAYMVYKMDEMIKTGEKAIEANAKASKVAKPLIDELNALKNTLVITSGDNYVDSAPPQLREKLGQLYSDVAANYEAPSQAQLENLALLSDRYEKAATDLDKILSKRLSKFTKYLEKENLPAMEFKSKEDFLK
ncbi:WD40/YVTN/BNR-like repeat-containing protein [Dokdonia ponticola]|uniref:WD40/YVTN/BNR-like repeat-containing protein n=1 Tax=Dokdonia ponticola TaxID=2041041 RepID=A0ABV9I336_9FLAO